jgi:hypothetical protein
LKYETGFGVHRAEGVVYRLVMGVSATVIAVSRSRRYGQ